MGKLGKVGIGVAIVFSLFIGIGIVATVLDPTPPKKIIGVEKPKSTPKVEKPKPQKKVVEVQKPKPKKVVKKVEKSKPKVQKKKSSSTTDLRVVVKFDGKQFTIINQDSFDWTQVKMEINSGLIASGYILEQNRLKAKTTYTVGALQFAKPDGQRLNPYTTKVLNFTIRAKLPSGQWGWWYGGWE